MYNMNIEECQRIVITHLPLPLFILEEMLMCNLYKINLFNVSKEILISNKYKIIINEVKDINTILLIV